MQELYQALRERDELEIKLNLKKIELDNLVEINKTPVATSGGRRRAGRAKKRGIPDLGVYIHVNDQTRVIRMRIQREMVEFDHQKVFWNTLPRWFQVEKHHRKYVVERRSISLFSFAVYRRIEATRSRMRQAEELRARAEEEASQSVTLVIPEEPYTRFCYYVKMNSEDLGRIDVLYKVSDSFPIDVVDESSVLADPERLLALSAVEIYEAILEEVQDL